MADSKEKKKTANRTLAIIVACVVLLIVLFMFVSKNADVIINAIADAEEATGISDSNASLSVDEFTAYLNDNNLFATLNEESWEENSATYVRTNPESYLGIDYLISFESFSNNDEAEQAFKESVEFGKSKTDGGKSYSEVNAEDGSFCYRFTHGDNNNYYSVLRNDILVKVNAVTDDRIDEVNSLLHDLGFYPVSEHK